MDQIKLNFESAELTHRQRALCEFARDLTLSPTKMDKNRLLPLREAGLGDAGILDATQVVSYFNYINRVADALGVPAESEWDPKNDG